MNNLWGSLPPELYHLRYLKTLFISENELLSGEIPFQYGWWKNLDDCKFAYYYFVQTWTCLCMWRDHSHSFCTVLCDSGIDAKQLEWQDPTFVCILDQIEDIALRGAYIMFGF